jgi:hypothetical protein
MTCLGRTVAAAALLICVMGCDVDDRPVYAAPKLPAQSVATLRGCWGTYIEEVDGARVADASFMMSDWGGDIVPVTPGAHNLHVVSKFSGQVSQPMDPSGTFNNDRTTAQHYFSFLFVAGHTYDIAPKSLFQPTTIRITDKNTGQTMVPENTRPEDPGFMMARPDPFHPATGRDPTRDPSVTGHS